MPLRAYLHLYYITHSRLFSTDFYKAFPGKILTIFPDDPPGTRLLPLTYLSPDSSGERGFLSMDSTRHPTTEPTTRATRYMTGLPMTAMTHAPP